MGAVLNPEQWPLMADLQAKDQRAQAGGERRGSRRGSGREAAASAHFLLKICFKVSPAHLPQGTPQFPRLCGENERVMRWEEERETSLAPHERLSELPVVPREKSDTGAAVGENPRDAPVMAR